MSAYAELVDRYIAAWNEPDPERRLERVRQTYAEDATYLDPLMRGEGHRGIADMIGAAQAKFPGHRFRRTGEVQSHNGRVRFWWALEAAAGGVLAKGTDVGEVADGRFQSIVGFLDEFRAETVAAVAEGGA